MREPSGHKGCGSVYRNDLCKPIYPFIIPCALSSWKESTPRSSGSLSVVVSRYRDYARSAEQVKAFSGDAPLMRGIASRLDEAPRPITGEYKDFTPFLLLLMLSEELSAVRYVERLVTWYCGFCRVDEPAGGLHDPVAEFLPAP